jgi:iron complex outermembrane receptor protein
MDRRITTQSDYSDYSFFYDSVFGSTVYDNGGHTIDPSQAILGEDHFTKESHELRVASPKDFRLRFVGGLFYQRQFHFIQQRYFINDLASALSVDGWPNTIWLTKEYRVDRDMAAFGEATFDITDKLSATAGLREYKVDNSLAGFAGLQSYESPASPHFCSAVILVPDTPCTNVNADVKETGDTYKFNLTYQIDPDHMIYATQSTGFRPGGVNRAVNQLPYKADYLTNDEIGWKTSWFGNSLRWNGDFYAERWSGIQFSTILPSSNGLTVIFNAGDAEVRGIESDISWRATQHLSFTAAGAFTDAHLITNYCFDTTVPCTTPDAPKGSQLPVTPKYKANMTARYTFTVADMDAHIQGAVLYQSANWPALVAADRAVLGQISGYTTADFAAGIEKNNWNLEFAVQNVFDTHGLNTLGTECATQVCSAEVYATPIRPRLFSLKFGQKF